MSNRSTIPLDPQAIDGLYGLDPVIEPGDSTRNSSELTAVQCPYCGESFETTVDLSAGSFS